MSGRQCGVKLAARAIRRSALPSGLKRTGDSPQRIRNRRLKLPRLEKPTAMQTSVTVQGGRREQPLRALEPRADARLVRRVAERRAIPRDELRARQAARLRERRDGDVGVEILKRRARAAQFGRAALAVTRSLLLLSGYRQLASQEGHRSPARSIGKDAEWAPAAGSGGTQAPGATAGGCTSSLSCMSRITIRCMADHERSMKNRAMKTRREAQLVARAHATELVPSSCGSISNRAAFEHDAAGITDRLLDDVELDAPARRRSA